MKVATWNVNGVRARETQLREWLAAEAPDVACLQEIKAGPGQVPGLVAAPADYWAYWHGSGPYSGVALLVRRGAAPSRPAFTHPGFDRECRVVTAEVGGVTVASVYVPNGGKDYGAKLRFLEALDAWVAEARAAGRELLVAGDVNVTRSDMDVHPKERKPGAVGQRPDERALLERLLARGLVDLARALHPQDADLFTWWAPWRSLRQRNVGWRIDYLLATEPLARAARACDVRREVGTSDHAPVVATFDLAAYAPATQSR